MRYTQHPYKGVYLVPCPIKPVAQLPDYYIATLIRNLALVLKRLSLNFNRKLFVPPGYISIK